MSTKNQEFELDKVWNKLCKLFSKTSLLSSGLKPKEFFFNQISQKKENDSIWKEAKTLLEELSIEETELLLSLSKTNEVHINTHFKVYTFLLITVPSCVIYFTYNLIQHFVTDPRHLNGAIGGAKALFLLSVIFVPILIGRLLIMKWRHIEMITCLESIIIAKKANLIHKETLGFHKLKAPDLNKISIIENSRDKLTEE
jgi:hypothetical protein